jgi:hypothetical protein
MVLQERFRELLVRGSAELYQDHRDRMDRPDLLPTPNVIDEGDLALFFEGLDVGLITLERGGRFNTLDRPAPGGRWSLLSRSRGGGWYNAEYLALAGRLRGAGAEAQLSCRPSAVRAPTIQLPLDLAVVTDRGTVAVLGAAKRAAAMLDALAQAVRQRFSHTAPGEETRRRGDEARQLAWPLWLTRTPICG